MDFLLSHWHCIVPLAAIAVAMLFMRGEPKGKKGDEGERSNLSEEN